LPDRILMWGLRLSVNLYMQHIRNVPRASIYQAMFASVCRTFHMTRRATQLVHASMQLLAQFLLSRVRFRRVRICLYFSSAFLISPSFLPPYVLAQSDTTINTSSLCDASLRALGIASRIRGLAILREVPCAVHDKPSVERFLLETIKTDLPPLKLEMEELTFKTLGLIPDNFQYSTRLIEFLVSQIGGYYDPKKKLFVMAAWLPAGAQEGVAIHEQTHALQDQHHNLQLLLKRKASSTDSDLAISALVEGDASAVMFDHQSRLTSATPLEALPSVDPLVLLQVLGTQFDSLQPGIPSSIKGLLVFPYTSGLRFAHALLTRGGYREVERAYSRLPTTSREILHPEEFISGSFAPSIPHPPELPGYSATRSPPLYIDTLGEFGISSILSGEDSSRPLAADAARGWVGDLVGVFPIKDGKQTVSWITRWESVTDRERFVSSYTAFLISRYKLPSSPRTVSSPLHAGPPWIVAPHKSVQIISDGLQASFEFTLGVNALPHVNR
jgi:hypothetical protein